MSIARIVSCTPSTTEILAHLGLADCVVGADTLSVQLGFCHHAQDLGPVDNINVYTLRDLKPDLVIFTNTVPGADAVRDLMREEELPLLELQTERFDDLLSDIFTIGVACECEDKARELVDGLNQRIKRLCARVHPGDAPLRAYFELFPNPFVTPGAENWISDILKKAGAVNVFSNIPNPTFIADEEVIVERDPEVIFICWLGAGDDPSEIDPDDILGRKDWQDVTAIKRKNVHILPESLFNFPGPRLIEGLELMIELVGEAGD